MQALRGAYAGLLVSAALILGGCDRGSEAEAAPTAGPPPSWLSPTVAVVFFDEGSGREVPGSWAGVDAALRAQPGFQRNLLFGAQQSEHPYVSFVVWDDAEALASALAAPTVREKLVADVAAGTYERAEHRGDVSEAGAAVTIVPITGSVGDMEEKFRQASAWFARREGFLGALLLRRVAGATAPYVLVARWRSADAFAGVTADRDFPLHTSGVEGILGTYVPVTP